MSDLQAKTIVVTGANSGIGRVTAQVLAQRGATVVLCCRNLAKATPVQEEIRSTGGRAEVAVLNLRDLKSVRDCAADLSDRFASIDVLINNAGLAGRRGTTHQGIELIFGVNHLGHFLLTELLLPRLLAAGSCRVVNVSSVMHYKCRGIDFEALRSATRSLTGVPEYSVSKLANILHAKELARRYGERGLRSYAVHPGVVKSNIWRAVPQPFQSLIKWFMISNQEGAKTTLHVATSQSVAEHNGRYYDACREKSPSPLAQDPELARRLWEYSQEWSRLD